MNVAVAVGGCVGVPVLVGVSDRVALGGSNSAVCVCAAPAVPAITVSIPTNAAVGPADVLGSR
jgi:hypothetical protein